MTFCATSYAVELGLLKEKLECSEYPGSKNWCYIDPSTANHIPLALNDIQLWAKCIVSFTRMTVELSS